MSARELVGRPLVPFFDAHDNVNESLQLDATHAHEQLDVDARVWDKELGYFVYPSDKQHSAPIPIRQATPPSDAAGSFGKLLLTPDMLSRSAPSASGAHQLHNTMGMTHAVEHRVLPVQNNQPTPENESQVETPRSASTKRGSRQKNRSSTPTRSRRTKQRNPNPNPAQTSSDGGSSGGEDRSDGSDKPNKKKTNKNEPGSAKKSRNKQPQTPQKSNELSANGKWAWSAFQSSPDPKSLPLPPFVAGASPNLGAMPPPLDPPKVEERLDPPTPPYVSEPEATLPPHPASIEHSMTQDLRRMLNIGS